MKIDTVPAYIIESPEQLQILRNRGWIEEEGEEGPILKKPVRIPLNDPLIRYVRRKLGRLADQSEKFRNYVEEIGLPFEKYWGEDGKEHRKVKECMTITHWIACIYPQADVLVVGLRLEDPSLRNMVPKYIDRNTIRFAAPAIVRDLKAAKVAIRNALDYPSLVNNAVDEDNKPIKEN